jgi:hypothetical protein
MREGGGSRVATATKRSTPPTHPTVWIGLGMAAVGLLVALYAYTGARVYDIVYAVVALVGGIVALAGILTSAWGRAIMSARASRARRATMQAETLKLGEEVLDPPPPTVAEPPAKRRLALPRMRLPSFSLRAKGAPPPTPPPAAAEPVRPLERITLQCPQCGTQFTVEGARPMDASCPSCAFSAHIPA